MGRFTEYALFANTAGRFPVQPAVWCYCLAQEPPSGEHWVLFTSPHWSFWLAQETEQVSFQYEVNRSASDITVDMTEALHVFCQKIVYGYDEWIILYSVI